MSRNAPNLDAAWLARGSEALEPEVTYLDLDGDGLPDAVLTRSVVEYNLTGDGLVDTVETVEELATGIGVDGEPEHRRIHDTVAVDFDHDGTSYVVHDRIAAA